MSGLGLLVFSSITGWLAHAGLCLVVFQDGSPSITLVWQFYWKGGLYVCSVVIYWSDGLCHTCLCSVVL